MSNVKITVGGAMEEDASRHFVNAWHKAERGEAVHERHLPFESWDALARVMTGKRMELLHYVRRHKVGSVRALAKALGRDYSNVRADVQALAAAGLLDTCRWRRAGRLRCDRNEDRDLRQSRDRVVLGGPSSS
jgi:predicted transcriptional regulator